MSYPLEDPACKYFSIKVVIHLFQNFSVVDIDWVWGPSKEDAGRIAEPHQSDATPGARASAPFL